MSREFRWIRIVTEGGVIIVSILLAFGIDAWWDGRLQREEERLVLERLRDEFIADLNQLMLKQSGHADLRDAALELLTKTGDLSVGVPSEEVANLLYIVSTNPTFDPAGGALSSLIASGQLSLISNPSLRSQLAAWPGAVADLVDQERANQTQGHERLLPYLEARTSWRWVMAEATAELTHQTFNPLHFNEGRHPVDVQSVLLEREFEGVLVSRLRLLAALLPKYEAAIEMARAIIGGIASELETM